MFTPCLALAAGLTITAAFGDWPAWRGPAGNGVATDTSVPLRWSRTDNVRWKIPLSLPANGSPVVAHGKVFLTTPEDSEGKGRSLACYDRADGRELWKRTVRYDLKMPTHRTNPYGGSTPAVAEDRVVVWHSSAGLHCYDLDGEPLWSQDLGRFEHEWGYGTSPILFEDTVIVQTGPGDGCFLAAFDLIDGEELWRHVEPDHRTPEQREGNRLIGSWSTPLITEEGVLLCGLPTRLIALDPIDGTELWTCAGLVSPRGDLTYSSPTVSADTCIILGGYEGPVMGVRLGGEGDVTATNRLWYQTDAISNVGSGVYSNGHFFVPQMTGHIWCIDAQTGKLAWRERVGRGQIWSSIVAVGDQLMVMNQDAQTIVFAPNPSGLKVLADNQLDESTNSTPAISDGQIFLRTHEHLYCIGDQADSGSK